MEEPQRLAEEPLTGARGDGVKTLKWCEYAFWGQNIVSRGVT